MHRPRILGNSVIWNNQYTNKEISGIYTAVNNYVAILYNLAHNGEIISAETSTWDDHVYVLSNDNMEALKMRIIRNLLILQLLSEHRLLWTLIL